MPELSSSLLDPKQTSRIARWGVADGRRDAARLPCGGPRRGKPDLGIVPAGEAQGSDVFPRAEDPALEPNRHSRLVVPPRDPNAPCALVQLNIAKW
jgi:hypothetical protein